MKDELEKILEAAMLKEVAAEALYRAAQSKTKDRGVKSLLGDLAAMEKSHLNILKKLAAKREQPKSWHLDKVTSHKLSEYLTGGELLEGASLQETLIFAAKQENRAIIFYTQLKDSFRDEDANNLCNQLIAEETSHKLKLESLYEEMFLAED